MKVCKKHRNAWTQEEDKTLKFLVEEKKMTSWVLIFNFFLNRSNKDCRDHYVFHLSPNIVKRKWTDDEEQYLLEKYQEYGPKWVKLSSFFNKRSPNDIKNRVRLINQRKKPLRKRTLSNQDKTSKSTTSQVDNQITITNLNDLFKININMKNLTQNEASDHNLFFDFFEDIDGKYSKIDNFLNEAEIDDQQHMFNIDSISYEKDNPIDILSFNNIFILNNTYSKYKINYD